MGRLVDAKVKEVCDAVKKSKNSKDPVKIQVDLDMRKSTLLENEKKLKFDDIELQGKGTSVLSRELSPTVCPMACLFKSKE